MRQVTDDFLKEISKEANKPIVLYQIDNYDDAGSVLRFAEYSHDVVWNGQTFRAFPVTHEFVSENLQGEVDSINVKFTNLGVLVGSYVFDDFEWYEKKVTIYIVFADRLDSADDYISDVFYIDSWSASEKDIQLTLVSRYDVLAMTIPGRRIHRSFCCWKFKGDECGYIGTEAECNKTLTRCRELNNQLRFGGFPAVPPRYIYDR